ncbi:hypothetical protein [Marinilabilia rubra]|uniref:Lipoprotein n=1 Tax=Marinilabilia rubra TaxID=2162893 RepID=A0A2U2BAN9_9BACT|nr:hypothetical protein [Marinilabilia rubra]PWE00135.1 hypothetical protein DDZ16_07190 [Marinilabilia rubra]
MKKKIFYLPLILLSILGAIQVGCQEEDEEICESFDANCDAPNLATTCCTDDVCYYEYNGKKYEDTASGETELIADMCGTGETQAVNVNTEDLKMKLKSQTKRLMAEARAAVICQ